jgi:TP901 family phage tail tape measure protein
VADYNLGTARGIIQIDYRGTGPKQAAADINATGAAASKSSGLLGGYKKQLIGLGAGFIAARAIVGGFAAAIKTVSDFEKQMSAVGAVSGATASQMDALRGKAIQLGRDTVFTSTEAAQAMEELVKAGLSVDDVLNGAADAAVALAAAGGIGIPEAATLAANAMNQFNLSATEMMATVDTIAGAANASAIDVSQLGQSLKQVGAVANLAGLSFDDTATAIAEMGNAGIVGSDAGTSLKTMLQNLQPTTLKQINLFKELGLLTEDGSNQFFDAAGNIKSYGEVSQVLQNALKGQTNQQKLLNLETLFGTDAIRAAAIAANEGSAGFDALNTEMHKVTAADVAAKRLDNLSGSVQQLGGSIEAAILMGGSGALPALRSLVDGMTEAVNAAPALAGELKNDLGPGFSDLFKAISNVVKVALQIWDIFDGLVGVLAKLSLGVVIMTFNTLAHVLEMVTGLLEGQGPAIAIVVGAWILLANGGIGVVIARLGTFAAYAVIKALDGLMLLQSGATSAGAGMKVLAAEAAASIASLGAMALIVAAVTIWNSYKQAVEETNAALAAAADAKNKGDFQGIADQIENLRKKTEKYKDLIENVDVTNVKDAGKFLNNAFNPTRWGDVGKLGEYKDSLGSIEDAAAELTGTLHAMGAGLTGIAEDMGLIDPSDAQKMMDLLDAGDPAGIAAMNDLLQQMQPLLDKAGISAAQFQAALAGTGDISLGDIEAALNGVDAKAAQATGSTESLADAAADFANKSMSAADAAKALDSALDNLIGVELSASEAGIKWREALKKLQDGLKNVGAEMFNNTAIGDANKQLVIDATKATLDRVTAEAKAGTSLGTITKMFQDQRKELIQSAGPTKVAQDAMRQLLNTYNFTPKAVRTLVEAVGADRAQTKVDKLTAKYKLTPDQVTTIFEAAGADSASAKVKALRDYIKQLKGKDAPVDTPGAKESTDQIKTLKARIDELRPKATNISAPGAAQAAQQIQELKNRIDALRDKTITVTTITRHVGVMVPGGNRPIPVPGGDNGRVGTTVPRTQTDRMTPAELKSLALAHRSDVPVSTVTAGRGAVPVSSQGTPATSRIVRGTLSIDPSGKAFIRGIAEDVVDDSGEANDRRGRMN